LIHQNVTKKWKCEKAGEKSAFVVLKLEKPYRISQIDIGNEFSGVIEVLVGKSQQDPPKFHEILMATSFMTIIDARNETNPNRTRMFSKDLFVGSVADQKWDLVKILCTQTFNNRKQYGISFINLFTNEEVKPSYDDDSPVKSKTVVQQPKPITPSSSKPTIACGKFQFRDSSSEDEGEITSPFAKWKNKKASLGVSSSTENTTSTDIKSSIKDDLKEKLASESGRKRIRNGSEEEKQSSKKDRNRSKGLMYDSDDDEPNEKLQKKIDKDKELKEQQKHVPKHNPSASPKSNKFAAFIGGSSSSSSSNNRVKVEPIKVEPAAATAAKSPEKPTKLVHYKPFNKLMEGVTFVLSGYQNPERGVIRQKALDMGATYKADWDGSCTHLV
jgi:DNA-repair protein XRCC1